MNKIILEHYPLSKLPADIQAAVGGAGAVRVTVEKELPRPQTAAEVVAQVRREKADPAFRGTTIEEATARIRALRDEWEDDAEVSVKRPEPLVVQALISEIGAQ